jgi:hypothetical protein
VAVLLVIQQLQAQLTQAVAVAVELAVMAFLVVVSQAQLVVQELSL